MKKLFKLVLLTTIFLGHTGLYAQDEPGQGKKKYAHVKERDISKTYPASGNGLTIENSFGNVNVNVWDKNEIKVDIHIEASSDDAGEAEKLFKLLDVKDWQEGKTVKFKTKIDENKTGGCKNCKTSMQINYEVHLPSGAALDVENSFGKINLPDFTGKVSLSSKFGSLTTGALTNADKITVEFGKATIKSMDNTDAVFKFSSIELGAISGACKMNIEFCSKSRIGLSAGLTGLNLKESYSTLNLKPADNLSASYEISTSFGNITDRTNANIKRTDTPDQYGPDSDRNYSGKSGSGAAKIIIKSSFGHIIIGEATDEELKGKPKKNKEKKVLSV
jgi:hypothetical protein